MADDQKLDRILTLLESLDSSTQSLHNRLGTIENRLTALEVRMGGLETRFSTVEENVRKILKFVSVEHADFKI